MAPDGVSVVNWQGMGTLPHFNPDLDNDTPPPAVAEFRKELAASDGVLISSPEYAHGVPGTLKNALDWVVGSGEFVYKPVSLVNASPRSAHAQASLTETLTVMTATLVPDACVSLPLPGKSIDEAGIMANGEVAGVLRSALQALTQAIIQQREAGES